MIFGETSVHLQVLNSHMLWTEHLTYSDMKTSKHLIICKFQIAMWFWVKHLNICSSGGFEQSYASSKTFCFSVVITSKHLFIWRFWTVRCFEQNIYFSQVWKHLNIWSSVILKESCGLNGRFLVKHPNIHSSAGFE